MGAVNSAIETVHSVKGITATIDKDLKPTIELAKKWAAYTTAAGAAIAVTQTLIGRAAINYFEALGMSIDATLKSLCSAVEVNTNLNHEDQFPQWVHDFVSYQVKLAAGGHDLEDVNRAFLLKQASSSQPSMKQDNPNDSTKTPHYFFVYHPGTDWHAPFNTLIDDKPIPGFIGATNSLEALKNYLPSFREIVGPEACIHILLPSAHAYVIPERIIVGSGLHPIRITGQRHRSGLPYVHAALIGLADSHVQDVTLLPIPNELSAGTRVAAIAGGVAAGLGGAVVGLGGAVAGLVVLEVVTVATPAVCAASALAGLVGGGSTAGTLAALDIKEKARWKNTRRDPKYKSRA